jgi:voltage-gated potassium channel
MYFTMVTVATVGYGDIVPVTARARLIDAFFIVPIRIVIWFVFLGIAYQFVIQRVIEEFRMKRLQKQLRDHVVVCGYGLSGSVAVRELLESGFAADAIVVIDPQQDALEAATALGVAGLLGDPSREDLLQQAQVRIAKAVIIAVSDDAIAILLTLTVRSVAPETKIVVRIQEQTYQRQLRQAGADVIVSSTKIGGLLLADAVDSNYIVPFINDLLSARGRVNLVERGDIPGIQGCQRIGGSPDPRRNKGPVGRTDLIPRILAVSNVFGEQRREQVFFTRRLEGWFPVESVHDDARGCLWIIDSAITGCHQLGEGRVDDAAA